ncbi:MAG: hypothetical protein PSX80_12915 [bacterium]|nr:hypothetical protein [bacterium]
MARAKANSKKSVGTFIHDESKRKNIPTAEHESVMVEERQTPRSITAPLTRSDRMRIGCSDLQIKR